MGFFIESLKLAEGGRAFFFARNNAICVTFICTKKNTLRYVFKYKNPDTLRNILNAKKIHVALGFISKIYRMVLIPNRYLHAPNN